MKIHLYPQGDTTSPEAGGIGRVSEGMIKHMPAFGWEFVDDPGSADIIACHAVIPSNYLKLYRDKPFAVINHGLYWSEYTWEKWTVKVNADVMESIRVADCITAPSEWVAQSIRRATSREVTVVPHGIDAEDWVTEKGGQYVLWDKSRPDPICDPTPVVELAKLMPDVRFLSTFGPEEGLPPPNLAISGRMPFQDAKELVLKAGAYLATTRGTFEIGVLQALAAGLPIIGWKWGGPAEFLEHGEEAWLTRPGDMKGLVEGVRWAMANHRTIRPKAIAKAKEFPWSRACALYSSLFEATIAQHASMHAKRRPRTSVIVPAYNLDKYLAETIESVIKQSDQNWEMIIVDDASPDRCGEIADEYAKQDKRIKVIHNTENVYLAEARNVGIRASKGRYIFPLDADDMIAENTLQILADSLDQDRSIHVAYGGAKFFDENGPIDYGNRKGPGYSGWPIPYEHEKQIGPQTRGQLLPYSSMFRREAWEATGGYRRRWKSSEDCDFWSRITENGFRPKMVTEADTLLYRVRTDSMSQTVGWRDQEVKRWFGGNRNREQSPAGAVYADQIPISSCDPPVISVIIPCGPGHGKYVLDAIDSVASQTFPYWEVIVVFNGSSTNVPSWCRTVRLPDAVGVAKARNIGINMARGKWFLPLDADDILEPNALEVLFNHQSEGRIMYSDWWADKGTQDGSRILEPHQTRDYDPDLLITAGALHAVTALTPISAWETVGGYDENLPAWEDWDFQIACASKGICSQRIALPLMVYRMRLGKRREDNFAEFKTSAEALKAKYNDLFEGRKTLMGCGCSKTATLGQQPISQQMRNNLNGDASLVIYTGPKTGAFLYRGKSSGATYSFSFNEQNYVHEADIADLLNIRGFERVHIQAPVMAGVAPGVPVLVTD